MANNIIQKGIFAIMLSFDGLFGIKITDTCFRIIINRRLAT